MGRYSADECQVETVLDVLEERGINQVPRAARRARVRMGKLWCGRARAAAPRVCQGC
jgi:hypothetical protein